VSFAKSKVHTHTDTQTPNTHRAGQPPDNGHGGNEADQVSPRPVAHAHRTHARTHHGTADEADTQRRTPGSERLPPRCMTHGCREGQTTVARAAITAEGTPHSAAHSPASRSPRPRATKAQPGSKAGQPCGEEACAGKGTAAKQKTIKPAGPRRHVSRIEAPTQAFAGRTVHTHTDTQEPKHAQGGTTARQRAGWIRAEAGFTEPVAHADKTHARTHHETAQ
jgi:hypothetical protein